MNHWARPGVECECIGAGWRRGQGISLFLWLRLALLGLPIVGGRYFISAVGCHADTGRIYVRLRGMDALWFCLDNFRPLIKRTVEQDLELFAPLLDPSLPLVTDDAPRVPA